MDFNAIDEGHEDGEEVLHYYFNHEERIRRAPQNVQDFYNGAGPQPPKGILKSLTATKANRFGLFAIAIFCAFIYAYSLIGEKSYQKKIGGVEMTLAAFSYGDDVYVSMSAKNTTAEKMPYGAVVSATITAIDNQNAVIATYQEDAAYTLESGDIIIRTKFTDYDIVHVQAEVTFGEETKTLAAKVVKQ
ncbi:MAG: hypothetical protein J6I73_05320 [Treponema sp.]|nr:hypothetical protein [Treponema sp.]